ncbi:MAG: adenylate/guanylate cyclase domain-containing protein, partial [Magnetospirillum sp.]|nr:adenylate/guanylate cyclase domain-containing protein [Magnetospirillum sp.]
MAELAEALELVRGKKLVASADAETYTALAGVFREAWLASGSRVDLEHCRELFLRAFHISNAPRDGIDAAVTSWLLGDQHTARDLARKVRDRVSNAETDLTLSPEERYQMLATVAEAHLLLGEIQDALASFAWASTLEGIHYGSTVAALKQLALLQEGGLNVPEAVFDIIKPPTVVVFTGHALDRPGEGPHFPPELEAAVRAEIAKSLDELGAQVGYSMAACGSDLLFIEAMLERGAEVNVVMPYAIDDFIPENVRYGGSRWEMRFRNALKLANTVTYATEERYLGHGMLYRFANQCLHGLATLRASFLKTAPYLLAVWDMMPGSLVGGAADFIDQWEDISQLRIIDLDGLLQQHPELAGDFIPAMPDLDGDGDEERGEGRVIRSMMFCDIAGYSKLKEEHTPVFLDFLRIISEGMAGLEHQPIAINTWGDAIFAVMDKATPMAEYAQTLQEMVLKADEELSDRLPHPLNLRISLHAGPVFQAVDPICGRQNFYGSHINRAARLEPVTVIGHVYATQQFVAVLTAEQSALRSEAQNRSEDFTERFACEYVGVLSLAKDFGKQTVYHLRRRVNADDEMALGDFASGIAEDFGPEDFAEEEMPDDAPPPLSFAPIPSAFDDFPEEEAVPLALADSDSDSDDDTDDDRGAVLSDEDLAAILAMGDVEGDEDDSSEAALDDASAEAAPLGSTLSDDDLAAILAEAGEEEDMEPAETGLDLPITGISDDDLAAILSEASEEEEFDATVAADEGAPKPDFSFNAAMSDEDIAALLEESDEEAEDDGDMGSPLSELPEIGAGMGFSDDDLIALSEQAAPCEAEPPPSLFDLGGAMTDAEIAALLDEAESEPESEDYPQEEISLGGIMSDSDLAALLAEAE